MKFRYVLLCLLCLYPSVSRAELEIDIIGAMSDPLPLAFPDVLGDDYAMRGQGADIKDVVVADLKSSGLFRIIPERSYIQRFNSINDNPTFVDWQAIKSHALIQSAITEIDEETIKVEVKIWDVPAERQLYTQAFTTKKTNWRRTAHKIADKVYERLTGEKGYFDTRIVYISETGPATRRIKRLAVMDQDGANHKFLTSGNAMALTPRFSPNMQKIAYLSFTGSVPKTYILDIATGRQELVGHFPGMTFAPVFSPDSKKILFSYATDDGNSEIYEMNLETKETKQLTNNPAIDTSASYSPDGTKIVFNSDRGGNQQLYVMDVDGSNVERISFGQGRYATPIWSPRGDYIAYTKMANGEFYIGIMYPDGSGERLLASGYLVEAPVWAPNGRVLMYFRQERGGLFRNASVNLYTIDLTGYNERKIVTPTDASDPAWSPLLD